MITEGNPIDVPLDVQPAVEPLLISEQQDSVVWSNYNDPDVAEQGKVLNLNNYTVRVTLWCLIYLVLTTTGFSNNLFTLLNYEEKQDDTTSSYDYYDDEITYYRLAISSDVLTLFGVAILLCSFYCGCIQININSIKHIKYVSGVFIIIGGIIHFVTMIYGMNKDCKSDAYTSATDVDYCRALYVAGSIYFGLFSWYLALDIILSIGNKIKNRLISKSLFVAIRSILFATYWGKVIDNSGSYYEASILYILRTLEGGNVTILAVSIFSIILAVFTQLPKLHPVIPRILSACLLLALGSTLVIYFNFGNSYAQISTYYVAAVFLIAYDLQYL